MNRVWLSTAFKEFWLTDRQLEVPQLEDKLLDFLG